jgi:hypothetical protein
LDIIIEIRPESGLLNVGAIGEFSLQEAERTFLEMLEAVARYKVEKVLFDGRRLTGAPKTMERFYYGEFAADSVLSSEIVVFLLPQNSRMFLKNQCLTHCGLAKTSQ